MNGDPVDDALEALGHSPVHSPGDQFADRLEQHLRSQHAERRPDGPDQSLRRAAAQTLAVAAVALLVVGLALTLGPERQTDGDQLQLAAAEGTSLVLPDGTVVAAAAGMDLAEGTLVITSASGSARVDGVTVPPDRVAVVEDGRLRLLDVDTSPAPGAPTTAVPPATSTTAAPATSTTTTTRPPASTTSTTSAPARPPVAAIDLTAVRRDRRVVALRWSAYSRDDFARYVVVRTISDADGRPPDPGPSSTAVFSTADRTHRAVDDDLPPGAARAAYRVIVLDAAHQVVGASAVARV